MQCSVVVPVYNGADVIETCLDAMSCQTVDQNFFEIIVVDDGSTDHTPGILAESSVTVLRQERAGAAAARNRGVEAARGNVVLFTDADCQPALDWIEQMCRPFDNLQVSGVKGSYRTRQKSLVARFVQLEYEDKYRRMDSEGPIDFVDTYSAGYRIPLFRSVGGFDTRFPAASVEDQELSFRLSKAGNRLVFQPAAVVFHRHSETVSAYARKKFRIGYWKVLVHARHPDKLVRDSHTPQILKVQILLVLVILLGLGSVVLWPWAWWISFAAAALLLGAMVPFCVWAWQTDRTVALVSPLLLLVRAISLGTGFAVGVGSWLFGLLPADD